MYICNECSHEFAELETIKTTYERYYGISSEFANNTPFYMQVCPYCSSNDYEEMEEEDYE